MELSYSTPGLLYRHADNLMASETREGGYYIVSLVQISHIKEFEASSSFHPGKRGCGNRDAFDVLEHNDFKIKQHIT
jgi:hypothetical protein